MGWDYDDYKSRMTENAAMVAMVGIIAGRQLSGKKADPKEVADMAMQYGEAMADMLTKLRIADDKRKEKQHGQD